MVKLKNPIKPNKNTHLDISNSNHSEHVPDDEQVDTVEATVEATVEEPSVDDDPEPTVEDDPEPVEATLVATAADTDSVPDDDPEPIVRDVVSHRANKLHSYT